MIIKGDTTGRGFLTSACLLGLGVLIGVLAPRCSTTDLTGDAVVLNENLRPQLTRPELPDNELETLEITLDAEASETLQRVRDRAMQRGVIIQGDEDTVPCMVELDGRRVKADVRIKGDWVDHVNTPKWSLRVMLKDDKLFGMRVFSIQAPLTRGNLWEWLVLEAARRENVLAPRATFVNVVLNNNHVGVYYLEEHFSKELVEAQGRRDGPIVLWDESTHWATLLQNHNVYFKEVELPIPASSDTTMEIGPAFVRAYGEGRLASSDSLNRSFFGAVREMEALQKLIVSADEDYERMRRLDALENLQGETLESLVDVDRLACFHALASLFQVQHSLFWHNMRFYHDPVTDRLEPIMYDNMAHQVSSRDPVMFRPNKTTAHFVESDAYYDGVFLHLARMCEPGYLDALRADVDEELSRFEAALLAEENLAPEFTVAGMFQRLRTQQAYLRQVLYPVDAANFSASYELDESAEATDTVSGTLEVTAWATTRTPVVVEGFRFSNDKFAAAFPLLDDQALGAHRLHEGGVVLPNDGRAVTFRFPIDERLANLENVQQILAAVREQTESGGKLDLDIDVEFRPIAASEIQSEKLNVRRVGGSWVAERGRPETPTLEAALAAHPFLEYDVLEPERLTIRAGDWEVDGDLVMPSGYALYAVPGTTLRFQPDAVLFSDAPLVFEGTQRERVVLRPIDGADRWRGICVVKAKGRSYWTGVDVHDTDAVARGGWVVTGGITFYHSPIEMVGCSIRGTLAEDGLNIFGTEFLLDRVTLAGCVSDSFDGDFVTGTVKDCVFRDGLADGVDFSGSDVDVTDCRFLNMGDKAVSAGENSIVRVNGGLADGVSIGIASKDESRVTATGMHIKDARNYALAAFIKKPEFGPSSILAKGIQIEGSGLGDTIVQTSCSIDLDGQLMPTQDLDVGKLYEEKILGQ